MAQSVRSGFVNAFKFHCLSCKTLMNSGFYPHIVCVSYGADHKQGLFT